MRGKVLHIILGMVFVVFVFAGFITANYFKNTLALQNKVATPSPKGETYSIVQAAERWPHLIEAAITPRDVHVGDTQKLSLVVEDREPITSVIAKIETDHGVKELPLTLVGPVAESDLQPVRYAVAADHTLVLVAQRNSSVASEEKQKQSGIAVVEAANLTKFKYEGSWTVTDTHDKTYHTLFTVKNAKGEENSITLTWTDACSIPNGGNWNMSVNCGIASTDGIDNGNATLTSGTLTLTSTFVFNPGNSIIFSGGTLAIGSGGQLKKTRLWKVDGDGDGYSPSGTNIAQDTQPVGGYRRRWTLSSGTDCYDLSANAYPGETTYYTTDRGDGSWDYNCDGAAGLQYGQNTILCDLNPPKCSWTGQAGFTVGSVSCGSQATGITQCYTKPTPLPSGSCWNFQTVLTQGCR